MEVSRSADGHRVSALAKPQFFGHDDSYHPNRSCTGWAEEPSLRFVVAGRDGAVMGVESERGTLVRR